MLDLAGDPVGEAMIREVDMIFGVVEQTMHLSTDEKMKYKRRLPDTRGKLISSTLIHFSCLFSVPAHLSFISSMFEDVTSNRYFLISRYKAQGFTKTETGAPDRCEFFNISQDELFENNLEEPIATMPPTGARSILYSKIILSAWTLYSSSYSPCSR